MTGDGFYRWRALDGTLGEAANWNDLPGEMEFMIRFEPVVPDQPHTQEDHDYMATFDDKLHEILKRCRR